jgi:hypothetical protein
VRGSLGSVAGDAVVELGIAPATPSRGNQARPPAASRVAVASPNRLLPLRVPPRARMNGSSHPRWLPAHVMVAVTTIAVSDQHCHDRELDDRTEGVPIELPAPPRRRRPPIPIHDGSADDAAQYDPDIPEDDGDRGTDQPSDNGRARAIHGRTRAANHAPKPSGAARERSRPWSPPRRYGWPRRRSATHPRPTRCPRWSRPRRAPRPRSRRRG